MLLVGCVNGAESGTEFHFFDVFLVSRADRIPQLQVLVIGHRTRLPSSNTTWHSGPVDTRSTKHCPLCFSTTAASSSSLSSSRSDPARTIAKGKALFRLMEIATLTSSCSLDANWTNGTPLYTTPSELKPRPSIGHWASLAILRFSLPVSSIALVSRLLSRSAFFFSVYKSNRAAFSSSLRFISSLSPMAFRIGSTSTSGSASSLDFDIGRAHV